MIASDVPETKLPAYRFLGVADVIRWVEPGRAGLGWKKFKQSKLAALFSSYDRQRTLTNAFETLPQLPA